MINIKGLSKRYGDQKVLCDLDLHIKSNEFVCIRGNSGSGKSTLLNIIGLIESPDQGKIVMKGIDGIRPNTGMAIRFIRENINYLFQNYALIDEQSVYQNMKLATRYITSSPRKRRDLIEKHLEQVGLENQMHKKIYQLSGGEQQRVALARAMLKPGDLILADEPTGSLDADNKAIVMKLIRDMHHQGRTIVMVTHDDAVCDYAQRVIMLENR